MILTLNQDNIKDEDKQLAITIRNHLRQNQFVIGNPALGLKKTLRELEKQLEEHKDVGNTGWLINDNELVTQIMSTKAGIEGEEKLSEYLSRLLKYDKNLRGVVAFASLSYEHGAKVETLGYIPDTDTILVYGRNILILDAKNIKTTPKKPLYMSGNEVVDERGNLILEINPSVYVWDKIFKNAGIEIDTITGYTCIVNNSGATIERDEEWIKSNARLIHIAELQDLLTFWTENMPNNTMYLDILTEIAKAQIKEDKSSEMDFDYIRNIFDV